MQHRSFSGFPVEIHRKLDAAARWLPKCIGTLVHIFIDPGLTKVFIEQCILPPQSTELEAWTLHVRSTCPLIFVRLFEETIVYASWSPWILTVLNSIPVLDTRLQASTPTSTTPFNAAVIGEACGHRLPNVWMQTLGTIVVI